MGNARYSDVDWDRHVTSSGYAHKTVHDVFKSRGISPDLDPSKFGKREALDSPANPQSTPIILGCDETGSMGELAHQIINGGLGAIMSALYDRKPVTDPQIMCLGIGDATCDQAPIQATNFEADAVNLAKQIEKIYIEGHGGGNMGESYALAWFLAAYKTRCDAIRTKRHKGYIFTIGDECPLDVITQDQIKRFFDLNAQADMRTEVLLEDTQKDWHVFHLIVRPVLIQPVEAAWKRLLKERAILVDNIQHLASGIVAIIEAVEGRSAKDIVAGRTGDDRRVAEHVTAQLTA